MELIMEYLTETLKQKKVLAERNFNRITKHDDIKNEFESCIKDGNIPDEGIIVEGYSAKDIQKLAPFMNWLGIYNFLISLRDKPEEAKQSIEVGFKIK